MRSTDWRVQAAIGEPDSLADPERLAALAAPYGTGIVGAYPDTRQDHTLRPRSSRLGR
jgi:hypothetical protein